MGFGLVVFFKGYVDTFFWLIDYIYVYVCLFRWTLTKEIFGPRRELNLKDFADRKGQVVVITGGTGSVGSNVVKKLLQLDMHVILGCPRNEDCDMLISDLLKNNITSGKLESITLNLCSFASVREFVSEIRQRKIKINVLINKAGIFAVPFAVTEDGFESQFQVNYLSQFLLTNLVLPNMISTANKTGIPGRITMVSSSMQYYASVNFDDIELKGRYNPYMAYFNSKWMGAMMARYLDAKLQAQNVSVHINSLHPGAIPTGLAKLISVISHPMINWLLDQILMNVDFGSDEVIYVAISPETSNSGGEYYVQRKPLPISNDTPGAQRKLWEISCHLTGIKNEY